MGRRLPAAAWVPRTKVVRPAPPADAVVDRALADRLAAWLATMPATLVAAQAGAGKTTLAAAVVDGLDGPVAWVGFDDGDDGDAVLELLLLALAPVVPGGCPGLAELLASPAGGYDPRRAAGILVNDLVAADLAPTVLVLDDLHALRDPGALAALDYLLAHAPAPLHLLLLARTEPPLSLARARAKGRLADVTAADLRFTADQADTLLNGHLGMDLRRDAVEAIVDAAGGWVTGVRLLARTGARPAGAAVYDYLVEEILHAEPASVRRFLLDTSVLTELTPARCEAVTGDADALAVLEDLHRRNEFLVLSVDPDGPTYRYHDLFAAFLRARLDRESPGRAADLHRRAAAVGDSPATRVEHLLAAGAEDDAADALEDLVRGRFPRPVELRRLASWIGRLAPSTVAARPWLHLAVGMADVQRGAMAAAVGPLEAALEALDPDADHAGHWTAARCLHLATNDHARFGPVLARLEASPRFADLPPAARVDHHVSSAYGALFAGRWDEVGRRVAAAVETTTATGDAGAVEVLAQHLSPLLAAADGALDRIDAYADWVERRFPSPPPMIRLGTLHQQAFVAFLRGRFDDALALVAAAGDLPERLGGLPYLRATLDWVETGVWFARGDLAAVARRIDDRRRDAAATDLDRDLQLLMLAPLARVLRSQRRVDEVAALAGAVAVDAGPGRYGDQVTLTGGLVRAHAAWAAGSPAEAADLLRGLLPVEDRARLVPFVGSARVDLALALADAGAPDEAMAELRAALRTAARLGMPGLVTASGAAVVPLLERAVADGLHAGTARAALDALDRPARPQPVAVPGSPAVLSAREVEVLRLLADGASNHDVAAALVVSLNTVKTHVQRVLAKLDARSRSEAVARARALHLL